MWQHHTKGAEFFDVLAVFSFELCDGVDTLGDIRGSSSIHADTISRNLKIKCCYYSRTPRIWLVLVVSHHAMTSISYSRTSHSPPPHFSEARTVNRPTRFLDFVILPDMARPYGHPPRLKITSVPIFMANKVTGANAGIRSRFAFRHYITELENCKWEFPLFSWLNYFHESKTNWRKLVISR